MHSGGQGFEPLMYPVILPSYPIVGMDGTENPRKLVRLESLARMIIALLNTGLNSAGAGQPLPQRKKEEGFPIIGDLIAKAGSPAVAEPP